jgi:phosphoglycolate phosphatase-like HAD superfamily hydrolase
MSAVAVDLDALADTRPLWEAWLEESARRYAAIADLDPSTLPADRGEAAARLDDWAAAGVGDWRAALARWAEDRAPVYLRRDARVAAALRALVEDGIRVGVFSDAPESLVRVALQQLGAATRVELVEAGPSALERLLHSLGVQARVVRTRDELLRAAD